MHIDVLQLIHPVHTNHPVQPTPHKTNRTYLSTFKICFPITPNYHNLHFSTPTDMLHIHHKAKLASLHSTCMAMLTVNGWILHLVYTPCSSISAFVVSKPMSSFNPLSFTLAYHTLYTYSLSLIVRVCALAACSPPGSACPYWISFYAHDKMAYFALRMQLLPAPHSPVSLVFSRLLHDMRFSNTIPYDLATTITMTTQTIHQ